jgi:predicted membrane protein
MDKKQMKVFGIVCLVICAVCIFVAIERYSANANNVRAINAFQQFSPLGVMMGGGNIKPATPAVTKYALLFAALSGIGGVVLLVKSGNARI